MEVNKVIQNDLFQSSFVVFVSACILIAELITLIHLPGNQTLRDPTFQMRYTCVHGNRTSPTFERTNCKHNKQIIHYPTLNRNN